MERAEKKLLFRSLISLVVYLVIVGALMFVPAGLDWMNGWFFLSVFTLEILIAIVCLWQVNREIFAARQKIQKGTKLWDRVLLIFLVGSLFAIYPIAGIDERLQWSQARTGVIIFGYLLFSIGFLISIWVEAVNKFAEPGVRIQTDRGQTVIDSGPYAFVRHPLYAGSFLLFFGMALALGSFVAMIPAATSSSILVLRTYLEDRTLRRELNGYEQYAKRVRYRLIPGVW